MTYKRLAIELVRRSAITWLEETLEQNNIEYQLIVADDPIMVNDKKDVFYFDCNMRIIFPTNKHINVIVGGTADDMLGVCNSVLWDENKKVLWMSVAETRKQLGITELNLKGGGND